MGKTANFIHPAKDSISFYDILKNDNKAQIDKMRTWTLSALKAPKMVPPCINIK